MNRSSQLNHLLAIAATAIVLAVALELWDASRVREAPPSVKVHALVHPAQILADASYRSYLGLEATNSELQLVVRACERPGKCPFHYSQILELQESPGAFNYWGWLANIRLPHGSYQAELFIRYPVTNRAYRTIKRLAWTIAAE